MPTARAAVPDVAGVLDPNVPLLAGPSVEPVLDTVIALNMVNDPEHESFEHPVGVAYGCSTGPFEVYWYQCNDDQLAWRCKGNREASRQHARSPTL